MDVAVVTQLFLLYFILPLWLLAAMLGLVVLLEILPYLEEFWRGWRANDGHLVPRSRR